MRLKDIFSEPRSRQTSLRTPLVIAEAGVNHEGDMDLAKRLIDEACEGGAHAIKFQTYKAGTIASKKSPAYWDLNQEPTTSQYELFKKYDKFWKGEYEELKKHCDAAGIEFLSTPFDTQSAEFLNDLMDVFKISSSDISNKPFIRFLCGFDKPIILSTGAAHLWEIHEAVSWIDEFGTDLALLHCVLNYPTMNENAQLGGIAALAQAFPDRVIGYSDHTLPGDMKIMEIATLLGARIIEKHFTFDKTLPGNDHYHAMDKEDLKRFFEQLAIIRSAVGEFAISAQESEAPARTNARRSLVSARAIPAGKVIQPEDLTWKRPASGVSPRFFDDVVGMSASCDIEEDDQITWGKLKD